MSKEDGHCCINVNEAPHYCDASRVSMWTAGLIRSPL
jgi:hypothetical protein